MCANEQNERVWTSDGIRESNFVRIFRETFVVIEAGRLGFVAGFKRKYRNHS